MPASRQSMAALDSQDLGWGAAAREGTAAMIDRRELLLLAENLGLQPQIVEKDYVLGWLLAGIRANADLAEHWVFKGGTCLKKCYFETYRFSEDLDFSYRGPEVLTIDNLVRIFSDISDLILDASGMEFPKASISFESYETGTASSHLDRIRFAAASRLVVKLGYN